MFLNTVQDSSGADPNGKELFKIEFDLSCRRALHTQQARNQIHRMCIHSDYRARKCHPLGEAAHRDKNNVSFRKQTK